MLKHDAAGFHAISQKFTELYVLFLNPEADWKKDALSILDDIRQRCIDLDLDLYKFVDRIKQKVEGESTPPSDGGALAALSDELNNQFEDHLKKQVFLVIPRIERHWFEQCPLDVKVSKKFPKAATEIHESGRCLSLDRWAASVFHSMRALEYGLRAFASALSIRHATRDWGQIIDLIEKRIASLKVLRKGTKKAKLQHFCSEAAKEFGYFKNAWRNHVMHVKQETYDREEAKRVYDHVADFIERISVELSEDGKTKIRIR